MTPPINDWNAMNIIQNFAGGSKDKVEKASMNSSKQRFMKKMTNLAKKYQSRDNCSWKKALKKAGKKLSKQD